MPPTPLPNNVKLPRYLNPNGEYVLIPRDPWMTNSILGPMYGAKLVFVPKPDPVTNPSSTSPPTVIQPHPYAFENHPAHAARAKWLKDWEEKQRNPEKPDDSVDVPITSPSTSESHSKALKSQSGANADASPSPSSSAYAGIPERKK